MKKILLCILVLASVRAFGQAYPGTVLQNSAGNYGRPVPYPQILVCVSTDNNVPCVTRASTFTDDTLTTQCTQTGSSGLLIGNPASGPNCNNPGIGDVNGNFQIYVATGEYTLCTYSGTWQCQKFTLGTGGGIAATQCAGAINGALGAWITPQNLGCDNNITTDFHGNLGVQTLTAKAPYNGLLNLNTNLAGDASFAPLGFDWEAPSVTPATPYRVRVPNTIPIIGQVLGVNSISTNTNGPNGTHVNLTWLTPSAGGGGLQAQTNTVNNANCVANVCGLLNFANSPSINASNPSGGIEQFSFNGAGQLNNPSIPTVTPTGATGGASYSYGIVGCEDASCAYHSAISTIGSTSTGNATLTTSNYNALTVYADTLSGYRGYIICRTAGGATQGRITGAVSVFAGKKFNDTGLTGDGANCASVYASNTTLTYPYCLGSSAPGYPSVPGAPCGVDGPPLSPNAQDDEMGPTFGAPADVNSPFWAWLHQSVATASWTGGMISLQMANQATNQLSCLTQPLPAAPYRIQTLVYPSIYTAGGASQPVSVGFYEVASGKLLTFDILTGLSTQESRWTNTTTYGSTVGGPSNDLVGLPINIEWGRDGSNNLSFWHSQDGVQYAKDYTETTTATFTTAPDTMVICINPHNSASGTLIVDYDYLRVKNLAPGATF